MHLPGSRREIKHGSSWNAEWRGEGELHQAIADEPGKRSGAPEVHPRLPLASES